MSSRYPTPTAIMGASISTGGSRGPLSYRSELSHAILDDDMEKVKSLLASTTGLVYVLAERRDGMHSDTPLHIAARHRRVSIGKLLLKACPWAARRTNNCGEFPLHLALLKYNEVLTEDYLAFLRLLLRAYTDLAFRDSGDKSSLYTQLHRIHWRADMVRFFLEECGPKLSTREYSSRGSGCSFTLLHYFLEHPVGRFPPPEDLQFEVIQAFIEHGDPKVWTIRSGGWGDTSRSRPKLPIEILFCQGNVRLFQLALSANPEAAAVRDNHGDVALHRLLVMPSWRGEGEKKQQRLCRDSLLASYRCRHLQSLVATYPQALQKPHSFCGRLPLHIFMTAIPATNDDKRHDNFLTCLEMFGKEYPQAFETADADGLLPLHHATASAMQDAVAGSDRALETLQGILRICGGHLDKRGPSAGRAHATPFEFAAMFVHTHVGLLEKEGSVNDLPSFASNKKSHLATLEATSVLFRLLRECPPIVMQWSSSPLSL